MCILWLRVQSICQFRLAALVFALWCQVGMWRWLDMRLDLCLNRIVSRVPLCRPSMVAGLLGELRGAVEDVHSCGKRFVHIPWW